MPGQRVAHVMTDATVPSRRYRAIHVFDPDERMWNVRIESEPRCHSFGATLREARAMIREALELWLNLEEDRHLEDAGVELTDVLEVQGVSGDVLALSSARDRLDREVLDLQERTRNGARMLVGAGLTGRDAAAILGVSHQRVAQLVSGKGDPLRRRGPRSHRRRTIDMA